MGRCEAEAESAWSRLRLERERERGLELVRRDEKVNYKKKRREGAAGDENGVFARMSKWERDLLTCFFFFFGQNFVAHMLSE